MNSWRKFLSVCLGIVMLSGVIGGLPANGESIDVEDFQLVANSTMTSNSKYYEGLYEPQAGIYFGASYEHDNKIKSKDNSNYYEAYVNDVYSKKNSAYLMHLDFGTSIESIEIAIEQADEANVAIVLVWEVAETYSDMSDFDTYIEETAQFLRWLDVPVFISYGARMNTITTITSNIDFVNNFQYVSQKIREEASDIAIVWTVDDGQLDNINGFYPGDDFVDWVGISSFIEPGDDSLASIGYIIENYGNYKPVMLTEVGTARYARSGGQYMIEWAEQELRKLYTYVPMMYPQIKGIFLNNGPYDGDKFHFYDIHSSDDLIEAYNTLVDNAVFLSDVRQSGDERYAIVDSQKDPSVFIEGHSVEISTYMDLADFSDIEVVYRFDGKKMTTEKKIPYAYNLQVKGMSQERHTLIVEVYEDDDLIVEKMFTLVRTEDGTLLESGTFDVIHFDDIRSHWSEPYIIEVSKRGLVVGSEGVFRPDDLISRAEMTSVLTKLGKLPEYGVLSYKDVTSEQWYYKYVGGADDYLTGYGNYYYPNNNATREEIITALVKMKGLHLSDITHKDREAFTENFHDHWTIDAANKDYMILAVKYGIVTGYEDGSLKPQNSMKRGEMAKVIFTTFYQ